MIYITSKSSPIDLYFDSEDIINNIRKDKSMDGVISDFTRRDMKAGAILGLISKAKSEGISAKDYAKMNATNFKRRDISILYLEYETQLRKLNLVVNKGIS